ncbi:MAG: hypothetical protein KGL39_52470 [Patescibacteria group bacterium]|nr:hypothetical protein [Patescibacteria group bacterium]
MPRCLSCGSEAVEYRYHEWIETHGLDCGPFERCSTEGYHCHDCGAFSDMDEIDRYMREEEAALGGQRR